RVEVGARWIVGAGRVDDGELAALEERLERGHPRMESEEAVQVDGAVRRTRLGNRDRGARLVIRGLAERDDHVQAVHRTALEHRDEHLALGARCLHGAREELRRKAETDQCETAALEENASRHHVNTLSLYSVEGTVPL